MKNYNDQTINSAAEILSEAFKPKSKLNFDKMTVAQIKKAIKQGKATEKEVAAFYRNVQWDDLNESVEEAVIYDKIDYDQALSNVAYMAGGEHTDDKLMHAYAAALSFAFGIDDTDKVLKDLKHEISIVAPTE